MNWENYYIIRKNNHTDESLSQHIFNKRRHDNEKMEEQTGKLIIYTFLQIKTNISELGSVIVNFFYNCDERINPEKFYRIQFYC